MVELISSFLKDEEGMQTVENVSILKYWQIMV